MPELKLRATVHSSAVHILFQYKDSLRLNVDMSAASNQPLEEQFLCSICLDVFTDPVTTPCGHNFCKKCIFEHWDLNSQSKCPLCNEVFYTRPQLRVNTFISELVAQFRQEEQQKANGSRSQQQPAKPGDVPCDICSETKLRAVKTCLVCLASFCETHLQPHLTVPGLKRHQLMEPEENLEGRMCKEHDKPLELFCKTDQAFVCVLCSVLDHKTHEVASLREECEVKKGELWKSETEVQQMILERQSKIKEIRNSVWISEEAADREKAEGIQIFTSLTELIEKSLNELLDTIEEKQNQVTRQARGFIQDLEREISELMDRNCEMEQVSRSEDHLRVLQSFLSLNTTPPFKDWTTIRIHPPSYEGMVVRAGSQVVETLSEEVKKLGEAELKRLQQYAVDVTLDPDTANPELILSDDGKRVSHCDERKNLPDNPKRFSYYAFVAGKQSFSSGRFYFEVQVKEKTKWNLGVIRESVNRKGLIIPRPQNGFWIICLKNGNQFKALLNTSVCLSLKSQPEKVGVFVDYEEGLVSFYDADAAALIYSFTEKLYPYFCPGVNDGGKNAAPLIICPVPKAP